MATRLVCEGLGWGCLHVIAHVAQGWHLGACVQTVLCMPPCSCSHRLRVLLVGMVIGKRGTRLCEVLGHRGAGSSAIHLGWDGSSFTHSDPLTSGNSVLGVNW